MAAPGQSIRYSSWAEGGVAAMTFARDRSAVVGGKPVHSETIVSALVYLEQTVADIALPLMLRVGCH